jgi:hypothetical protein
VSTPQSLFTMERSENPANHLKYFADHPVIKGAPRNGPDPKIEKALRALLDVYRSKGYITDKDVEEILNG